MSVQSSSSAQTGPATLRGVFAPVLTPFHADLSPDVERWVDFSKQLLDDGCDGLCPFGTTSEANSLGIDERISMLDQLVDAGVPADVLMPGTGTCAIPDTVRLTRHAVELGCGGVLMLPPFYYKGMSDDGIFAAIAEVIERVGDARLRIYLYHIPPQAVVGYSLPLIERLIKEYPEAVVGIKDSSGDWDHLQSLLTTFPGWGIFTGSERFLLETLRQGGAGSINAVANVIAPLEHKLYEQWQSDAASALQDAVSQMRPVFEGAPPIPALKAIVAHLRNDPAWRQLRPPFVGIDEALAATIVERFEQAALNEVGVAV